MKDFLWKLFEKSGNIDAFLAYKEYTEFEQAPISFSNSDKKD
jgi:hypothetical protein